jgi:hypothetical protein
MLRTRTGWLLVLIGLLLNLSLLWYYYQPTPKRLVGDENRYFSQGVQAASGERSPYDLLWPPLYGEFVGLLFRLFGPQMIYVQGVQIGLWLASAFLFRQIVWRLTASTLVTRIAFALFLLCPELIAFSHYLWPEILHLFFWLLCLWLLICRPSVWMYAALAGLAMGLALLTKSLLTLFVPVVALFIWRLPPTATGQQRGLRAVAFLGLTLAVIMPVMGFNLISRDMFAVADSSIFNLWVGLNDVETADSVNDRAGLELREFVQAGPDLKTRNALYRQKISQLIQQRGLVGTLTNQFSKQYFRLFDSQTFFTTQLAGGGRRGYRGDFSLLSLGLMLSSFLIYGVMLISGAMGLCFIRLRPVTWLHLLVLFLAYNLALFLFLHVKTRYVIQFLPVLILFAASLWPLLTRATTPLPGFTVNRFRLALALFTGGLMTYLVYYNLITLRLLG